MQIYGPTSVHGPQGISAPHALRGATGATPARSSSSISDELHISDSARIADQLSNIPDIRQDRVNSIRSQIAQGTYDTDEKMSAALDSFLNEIA
jgi:negative regulator of flagellin synthesis FlgM